MCFGQPECFSKKRFFHILSSFSVLFDKKDRQNNAVTLKNRLLLYH
jgi:hypothetical protein